MLKRIALVVTATAIACLANAQFDGPAPLAWRWAQISSVPPGGPPIVSGDVVYLAVGQRMYALDVETGNQRWRYPAGEPLNANFRGGAVLVDGTLIGAGDDKTIYAVDAATGQEKWKCAMPEPARGMPAATGKVVVFPLADNSLMAVNTDTGAPLWASPNRIFDGLLGSISGYQGSVIYFTQAQKMVSMNLATLKVNWTTGFTSIDPDVSPVMFGDSVYVNSGNFLTCVNANTGRAKWQKNLNLQLANNPSVSADGILVMTRDGIAYTLDPMGRILTPKGIALNSLAVVDPVALGKLAAVCTTNGSMMLIDLRTGGIKWNYIVRPLTTTKDSPADSGSRGSGNNRGGPSQGGTGGGNSNQTKLPTYVTAAAPPVLSGTTLLLLARDGTLLAFDRSSGVDVTPPTVKMTWPNPGDQVSGRSLELAFRVEDQATGVNPDSVTVEIDGSPVEFQYTRDGVIVVSFSTLSKNKPLNDGRRIITVIAADWLGNTIRAPFTLTIDNTLPPAGRPKDDGEKSDRGSPSRGGGN